jgi:hypothetical protein
VLWQVRIVERRAPQHGAGPLPNCSRPPW